MDGQPISCKTLGQEIQHRGYQYRCMRYGRGPTHEEAYKAGAKLIIDMIRQGRLSVDSIVESDQLDIPFIHIH